MPSRRSGGGGTVRRKHSLGNLRRAHPASGAEWNVQVVRGKMSSKCLWHACRALILGLTLMLLGAGMATLGYYADYLSMGPELRGNATVRVKNDLKGFHLSNFSYVGPIVMGFGGFIVVASCVMTFEARDSAAKVVPARLRAGGGSKSTVRSNQSSSASQRRAIGMQLQSSRWDQHFGVFRSSPAEPPQPPSSSAPFDRDALTAELIKFSKSLSASARFSPQLRRLTYTGSVPDLSTHAPHHNHHHEQHHHHHNSHHYSHNHHHACAFSSNLSHLLSPHHKNLLLLERQQQQQRRHRHHRHRHGSTNSGSGGGGGGAGPAGPGGVGSTAGGEGKSSSSSGRQRRGPQRISNSLIQRNTRESAACTLLQPPANRLFWHAASFDESARLDLQTARSLADRTRRSDTAKRHVLARQKPIEQQEQEEERGHSPFGNRRRSSTMSDSSYSGRWTVRCASIASRASSIDSRRIQVDLHSPEVMPKSILRSPKRYGGAGVSATPSVDKDFRSQLSVCSEPPATVRQLSCQSSLEPCFPEENADGDDKTPSSGGNSVHSPLNGKTVLASSPAVAATQQQQATSVATSTSAAKAVATSPVTTPNDTGRPGILKKARPDSLPLKEGAAIYEFTKACHNTDEGKLQRSSSSRTFYRPKAQRPKELDDSIFYIRSIDRGEGIAMSGGVGEQTHDFYDSLQVINERRSTLLKADSETMLAAAGSSTSIPAAGAAAAAAGRLIGKMAIERKASNFSLMQDIPERLAETSPPNVAAVGSDERQSAAASLPGTVVCDRAEATILQVESDSDRDTAEDVAEP